MELTNPTGSPVVGVTDTNRAGPINPLAPGTADPITLNLGLNDKISS